MIKIFLLFKIFKILICLMMVFWLSCNVFISVNIVAVHQAQLVVGRVTNCGQGNHHGM